MALQGTLETFALPDVLRLLASTKKTGSYKLSGDAGTGSLWLRDGQVVGGEAPGGGESTPTLITFELLRFKDGDFVFDETTEPPEGGEAVDVETLLAEGERLLSEWQEIEAVVPSMDHVASLRVELPGDEVTIRADRWIYLVAIGGGAPVNVLANTLGQAEIDVCRVVKDLVELGVIEVGAPGTAPAGAPAPGAAPEPAPAPAPATDDAFDPGALLVGEREGSSGPDLGAPAEPEPFEPLTFDDEPSGGTGTDLFTTDNGDGGGALGATDLLGDAGAEAPPADAADAAEIARQLASLSPKAAKAVAAAAKATTPEEREAALADVPEEESINRELLIKFLGSVNS